MNAAVSQSEQVTVHTLDVVAGMLSSWLAKSKTVESTGSFGCQNLGLKDGLQATRIE